MYPRDENAIFLKVKFLSSVFLWLRLLRDLRSNRLEKETRELGKAFSSSYDVADREKERE